MPAEFGQPPRVTGRPESDLAATVDWLWSFYQAAILEAGLIQDTQLPNLMEEQFPLLVALSELEDRDADELPYLTGENTWGLTGLSAFTRTLLDDANAAAWQATLGITGVITDAELLALAGLVSAADRLPYFTGSGTASLAVFTSLARTLLDDTTESQMRTTLGLGTIATQDANNVAITGGSVVDAMVRLQTYTVATLPDAVANVRGLIYVSDEAGGAVPAFSDGVDWRRVTDRAVVS